VEPLEAIKKIVGGLHRIQASSLHFPFPSSSQ
jgi:hypothetical protein